MTTTPEQRRRAEKRLRIISIALLPFGVLLVAYSLYLSTQPGSRWVYLLLLGLVCISQTFILRRFIDKYMHNADADPEHKPDSLPPGE